MAAYIMCAVLLLTYDLASGLFESTPKNITPTRTPKVVLKCDPQLDQNLRILSLYIRKKSSDENVQMSQGVGQTGGTAASQESKEHPDIEDLTTPAPFELPKYNDQLQHLRRKRTSDNGFVSAMIRIGNNIDIVPSSARFNAEGDLQKSSFLSVAIADPTGDDVGVFDCETTYLDQDSNVKVISEQTQIREVLEISVDDLELRVKQLEDDRRSYTVAIEGMQNVVDECVQVNKDVQNDVTALQQKTDDLLNTITQLSNEVTRLSTRLSESSEDTGHKGGTRRGDYQYAPGEPHGDELLKLNARIDQLITNQIQALARNLKELRDYERNTQDIVIALQIHVSGPLEKRVQVLEDVKWQGIRESLQDMEIKTIPLIVMNMSDINKNITALEKRVSTCCKSEPQTPVVETEIPLPQTTATIPATTEETPLNYTVPACFVCGNNITEVHCTASTKMKTSACPSHQPYCITDIYEDGFHRHVYKRCASETECQEDKVKSSTQCSTDSFMEIKTLNCHFCCTTILCNSDLVPPKDMY